MKRIIYGKVTRANSCSDGGCKCEFRRSEFYVDGRDYLDIIMYSSNVAYTTIDSENIPEELKGLSQGDFRYYDEGYHKLNNAINRVNLKAFYGSYDDVYMHTCYSEWTCGDPGEERVFRLGELANLQGKLVLFSLE